MAKRLLILSEPLTPPSYSPRLTSLIRYLSGRGWQCTLESEPLPAHRRADSIFRYREYNFTKRLLRTYHAQDFDAVFCSTFYYFPLLTARSISKKWHLPLIIDVRDIAYDATTENEFKNRFLPALIKRLEKYSLSEIELNHDEARICKRFMQERLTSANEWAYPKSLGSYAEENACYDIYATMSLDKNGRYFFRIEKPCYIKRREEDDRHNSTPR